MKKSTVVWIIVIIVIILIAWYWWSMSQTPATQSVQTQSSQTSSPNPTPSPSPEQASSSASQTAATPVLSFSHSATLGNFLTAQNGMTLYRFTQDAPGKSNCSGTCIVLWHPYTVSSASSLVGITGITGKIGTITRADGTLQVTYNNMPLYFWHNDAKPGDTNGQNVGGVWFVVKP